MIKRSIVAIWLALLCCLAACAPNEVESTVPEEAAPPSMFVAVERAKTWVIAYHRDTKVMYAISNAGYNMGNFTLLVNPDGTPMIYNG